MSRNTRTYQYVWEHNQCINKRLRWGIATENKRLRCIVSPGKEYLLNYWQSIHMLIKNVGEDWQRWARKTQDAKQKNTTQKTVQVVQAPRFTPSFFGGVCIAHLFSFLCCVFLFGVLCLACPTLPVFYNKYNTASKFMHHVKIILVKRWCYHRPIGENLDCNRKQEAQVGHCHRKQEAQMYRFTWKRVFIELLTIQ
jgi:hypothetical protein